MDITIEKDVPVRMRDGVELVTDVYRPAGEGQYPTLVQRTPYNKELGALANSSFDVIRGVQAGYTVVIQDTRGRWGSPGRFNPFFDEGKDGADTIAWAAGQPWSSGDVGTIGGSYVGATQWLPAAEKPEALRAIAPFITASSYHEGWTYQGGAFELGFVLNWTLGFLGMAEGVRRMRAGDAGPELMGSMVAAINANPDLYWRTPLTDIPELGDLAHYYQDWLAHPANDEFWKTTAPEERYDQVRAPALNMGGWYDLFQKGTVANYVGMKAHGGSDAARRPHLVMGPWAHGVSGDVYPDRAFGFLANSVVYDISGYQLRWFDHFLKGEDNGVATEKPVKIFVMGADVWRDEDDWPLPDTQWQRWYLHSEGRANTAGGNGTLSTRTPGAEREDVYLYDPHDPVPTVGGATFLPGLGVGANSGPRDQREVERRPDVLVYTTDPLERDTEVTGPI
jgi:uncharacterized protein